MIWKMSIFYLRDSTFWRKNQPCFEPFFLTSPKNGSNKWRCGGSCGSLRWRGSRPRPNVSEGSIYWNRSKRSQKNRSNSMTRRGPSWPKTPWIRGSPRGLRMFVVNMDVSENSGTPKSSILIGFSIINHPSWGTTILETPIYRGWHNDGTELDRDYFISHCKDAPWTNQWFEMECRKGFLNIAHFLSGFSGFWGKYVVFPIRT